MRILYVGAKTGTSGDRIGALRRLSHTVDVVNPYENLQGRRLLAWWTFHTGSFGLENVIRSRIEDMIPMGLFDLAFVDNGELLGVEMVRLLKRRAKRVINFNLDNPYVHRDGKRWRLYLKSLPEYDLVVTPRHTSVQRALSAGARAVLEVTFSADEVAHRKPIITEEERRRFAADVMFVGTWMPERGAFLTELIERGVALTIHGPRWERAPEYPRLKKFYAGNSLWGDGYAKAISASKIALALLSKGNEDLHTTRSFEIPCIGTLLCAERTSEHLSFYREDEDALFFSDANECAQKCISALTNPALISQIASSGHRRVIASDHLNEKVLARILNAI